MDAGVDFEYVRHTFDSWGDHKQQLLANKIRDPTLPYITVDGKFYNKTASILRFLSYKLGRYTGSNEEEAQLADAYIDLIMDWTTKWTCVLFNRFSESELKVYKEKTHPQLYRTFNEILSDKGPFLLGESTSYGDFALYHMLEDDCSLNFDVIEYPYIATFVEAVQNRPNLKVYFATDRK